MSFPSSAYASDTISWTDSGFTSGSTVMAVLKHVATGTVITTMGTESGGIWTFTFTSQETSTAPAGNYQVSTVELSSSGSRETSKGGTMELLEPVDRAPTETHAAKMVRLLEAHLEGRLDEEGGRGIESYTIGGVPITKISHMDARSLLVGYRRDLANEEQKRRVAMGMGTGRRILTSFE